MSAKGHIDVLGRIVSSIPDAILATELARRQDLASAAELARLLPSPAPLAPVQPDSAPRSYKIAEWCAARKVSRSKLYSMWSKGEGPKHYKVGDAIRISDEADRAWLVEMEAANA